MIDSASRCLPTMLRRLALSAILALLFTTSGAVAHSFERSFASARYVESLDAGELRVLVVVEMPTLDVLGDFRRFLRDHPEASDEDNTERFRVQQLEQLAAAFELTVNQTPVEKAWKPVESAANGLGDADFFVYMIEHRQKAPAGPRVEVELQNRLQPAKVLFMSNRAEHGDGWKIVTDSSWLLLADGLVGEVVGPDVGEDASGLWSTKEAMRKLRVVFARSGE